MEAIALTPSAELARLSQATDDAREERSGRVSSGIQQNTREEMDLNGVTFLIPNPTIFDHNGEEVMYVCREHNGLPSGKAGFPLPVRSVDQHRAPVSSH